MATKKYVSFEKLGLYDEKIKAKIAADDAATLKSAKDYADSLAENYDAAGSAATVQGELDKEVARAQAAEAAALKAGQDAQTDVDALEVLVGELPEGTSATSVVDYVNVKTAGIATDAALEELQGQLSGAQDAIDAIEEDYLKKADKDELSAAITAEAQTARAAEKANADAIKAIQDDYLVGADKDELTEDIAAAQKAADDVQAEMDAFKLAAEVGDAAVDTLKEIQDYITTDGEAAAEMTANIGANAAAIEAVEGRMTSAEGKITTAEGKISANEQAIAALQASVGDGGSVEEMIEEAIAAEKAEREAGDAAAEASAAAALTAAQTADGKAVTADEKAQAAQEKANANEAALATKAAAADLTALAGRVTTAEGDIDALEGKMTAVEAQAAANKTAHEANAAAIAKKAEASALEEEITRATTKENELQAAIESFVECSQEDIEGLFQ